MPKVVSGPGGRIEIMPAQFSIRASDVRVLLSELKKIDPNLRKTLQKEMRTDLKPFATKLKNDIPTQPPVSNLALGADGRRWGPVNATVRVPLGTRTRKPGFYPVVSMAFRGRKGLGGFYFVERMRQGKTPQGRALVSALAGRAPVLDGLGRFVIPKAKDDRDEVTTIAQRIIEKYMALVNRRIK